jgi:hypothetical protein
MPKRKFQSGKTLLAASVDWATLAPRSKVFLTGEGEGRAAEVQARFATVQEDGRTVAEQCNDAARALTERMYDDFLKYQDVWLTFPKALNCLLDPELAPHFAWKVAAK